MAHLSSPRGHPNRAWSPPSDDESNNSVSTQALVVRLSAAGASNQGNNANKSKPSELKIDNATDEDFGFTSASAAATTQDIPPTEEELYPSSTAPRPSVPCPPTTNTTTPATATTATAASSADGVAFPLHLHEERNDSKEEEESNPSSTAPGPSVPCPPTTNTTTSATATTATAASSADGVPFPLHLHEESNDSEEGENDVAVSLDGRFRDSNNISTTVTTQQAAKRKSPPGTTTARQAKKKSKVGNTKITIGGRVHTTRKQIIHLLNDEQKDCLHGFPNSYHLFGTVKSGNTNKGYEVSFDLFPADHKRAVVIRKRLTTLNKNEEETQPNQQQQEVIAACATIEQPTTTTEKSSSKKFLSLSDEEKKSAKEYDCFYGEGPEDCIKWTILGDCEHITLGDCEHITLGDCEHITKEEDPLEYPDELDVKQMVDFEKDGFASNFFKYFSPSVDGHAKLMDKFHLDVRSSYYNTV